MTMVAQVADVKSTLVSVHRLMEAGNRVHFEPGNCYAEHIGTRVKTKIIERNGAFEVGFWVPRATRNQTEQTSEQTGNQRGFPRQDNEK